MTQFSVFGRFVVPVIKQLGGGRRVDKDKLKEFWAATSGLDKKHGCYVFSLRAGKGERPWYVGKASTQSFDKECFSLHKLDIYNESLGFQKKGPPCLAFVVPVAGKTPNIQIDEIEEYLIAYAASRNANLRNKRRLPSQKWSIKGVVGGNGGNISQTERDFKYLMGIE